MKVKVTAEHIRKAKRLVYERGLMPFGCCPIALALKDKKVGGVYVHGNCVTYFSHNKKHMCDLPQVALNFIGFFDMRSKVRPFSFDMHEVV
jgi:hypothetical protein